MTTDMNPVSPIQRDERRSGVVREWYGRDRRDCALGAKSKFHQYREFWEKRMIGFSTRTAGRSTRFGVQSVGAILGVLFFLLTLSASAQIGYSFYGQVVDQTGKPAPFATVRICAYSGAGNPCFPLASIYSDPALTHQITNPTTTDSRGNYNVFLAGGYYITQITVPGSGTYSYVLSASAGSGVVSINGVEGAFTFSGPGVTCTGTTCVFTGTGGGGSPGAPGGSAQFSNLDGTGFDGNGIIDTDVFLSGGGNNGIATAAAAASCTTASCNLLVPSSSVSTEASSPLPTVSGKQSSTIQDARGNALAVLAVNPQGLYNIADQYQGLPQDLYPDFLVYTNPNTGSPNQGTAQAWRNHTAIYSSPGFSNGASGCPLNCPLPPYTGVANWTVMSDDTSFVSFNTAGIRQSHGQNDFCYGIGDCTLGVGYLYSYYSGGYVAPSDEGFYSFGASHAYSNPNFLGTLSVITDVNHIKITPTQFGGTEGQGRFIYDSVGVVDTSGNSLIQVLADESYGVGIPGYTLPYATVVVNSANFPVSTATGTLATICAVPVQFGGLASTSCNVNVLTGTFNTTDPVCFMGTQANQMDIGVQLSSATALTGGVQTLTGPLHRSVGGIPVYVFQGGMCGAAIDLVGDVVFGVQGMVDGSLFPIMGSIDSHTVVVANYNSSQIAEGIPNISSNFVTTQVSGLSNGLSPGGYTLANLTRTSMKVTADITAGASPISLNNIRYYTISGCTDATFNQVANFNPTSVLASGQLTFTATGSTLPDSTCPSAKLTLQASNVSFYWIAEAYDVENHTDGINPRTAVDGTMTTSWQPHFTVGDPMVMPVHYSAVAGGINIDMSLSEPTQSPQSAFRATLQGTSSFGGSAFSATNFADAGQDFAFTKTLGGINNPSSVMVATGLWSNGFAMQFAPITGGNVISVGFAPNYYQSNPDGGNSYLHYNVVSLQNGLSNLSFDDPSQTWTFAYPITGTGFSVSPSIITSSTTHLLQNAVFEGVPAANGGASVYLPSMQMNTCTADGHPSQVAEVGKNSYICYNSYVAGTPVVSVPTPGTSEGLYNISIDYGYGQTFSNVAIISNAPTTISPSTPVNISCSIVPIGAVGIVYYNRGDVALYPIGNCPDSSATVIDTGVRSSFIGPSSLNLGGLGLSGAYEVNGAEGSYLFSNPNIDGNFELTPDPVVPTAGISQSAAGVLSVDTAARGNGLGILKAASFVQSGLPIQASATTAGGVTVSGGTCAITAITNGIITGATCTP